MTFDASRALLLVPTALELDRLRNLAPACVDCTRWRGVGLCGFGPVAAAATGAALIAQHAPTHVVLLGIAGGYGSAAAPLGTALDFGSVSLDGVGAGDREGAVLPSGMGFAQLPPTSPGGPIFETVDLASQGPELLTVCSASEGGPMLDARRARFPDAVAEDMEAFGVALSAQAAGLATTVVRGISNVAGDRDVANWKIDEALEAAADHLLKLLRQ